MGNGGTYSIHLYTNSAPNNIKNKVKIDTVTNDYMNSRAIERLYNIKYIKWVSRLESHTVEPQLSEQLCPQKFFAVEIVRITEVVVSFY